MQKRVRHPVDMKEDCGKSFQSGLWPVPVDTSQLKVGCGQPARSQLSASHFNVGRGQPAQSQS